MLDGYSSPSAVALRAVTQALPHVWCAARGWHDPITTHDEED